MNKPPKPYDLTNNEWTEDPWDRFLPRSKGFVTDFVYALRGTAVSTMFCVWSSLWAISTVLRRDAWLKWYPDPLYAPLYVILVGLSSISKKGTVINFAARLVKQMPDYIQDENKRSAKAANIIRNQATVSYIIDKMSAQGAFGKGNALWKLDEEGRSTGERLRDAEGEIVYLEKSSTAAIVAPELSVLLGKEKYNEGLIDFLTNLYDAEEDWDSGRRGTGEKKLKDLYVTLLGGTTPTHLQYSIPKAATGDGFVSRTALPYIEGVGRRKSWPEQIEGAPDRDEMARRLAWIAEHMEGEYPLTEEAKAFYEKFYSAQMDRIETYPELAGIIGRSDTILLQLSLLLKAQRYSAEGEIELTDIKSAETILYNTTLRTADVLNRIEGGEGFKLLKRVAGYIEKRGEVKRANLIQSGKASSRDVDNALSELVQRNLVRIKVGGKAQKFPTRSMKETYQWIGRKRKVYASDELE